MRESIHKQGQILEIIHNPHMDYDERLSAIREIVGAKSTEPKIIQIEAVYDYGENGRYQPHVRVFALYDDGTVKQSSPAFIGEGWQPYAPSVTPDIPQDEPAEPDPIAEIEAMGGRMTVVRGADHIRAMIWYLPSAEAEEPIAPMGHGVTLADLRAAAARLLARVRGASDAS